MANDANVFKIASTGADNVRPLIYESEILDILYEMNPFRTEMFSGIVDVKDYVGVAGNTVYIPKAIKLGAAQSVTDGDSLPTIKPEFDQVSLTSGITGLAVQMTLKQMRDQFGTAQTNIISQMATNVAELETSTIMTTLEGTSSAVIYEGGAADSDALTASDTFSVDLLNDGLVAMRGDSVPLMKKVLIISPKQEGDLRKLQQFTDASYLGSDRVNVSGFIGTFFGVNVISSNWVNSTNNSGSVPVFESMLVAEDALYIIDKLRPSFEMDRGDIRDMSMTFAIHMDTGYAIKRNEAIRILRSA